MAVKVFRLDITPEQARALADELGRAADASLFHPSIVEPVAAGIEGTVAYRAEEYVAAESLDVAMRHYAPATVEKALPFITQLASALDFARAAGVGHGALHPRDIFVTPDEARATGFGVVDALERLGLRAPVRRPYSPPERIAGQAWGTSADVFSLAAIAFELLTGRRPSGLGEDMGPLSGAALGERAEEIRAVLSRGMHESPSERFASARDFSKALADAAGVPEPLVERGQTGVKAGAGPRPTPVELRSGPSLPSAAAEPELSITPPEPAGVLSELPLAMSLGELPSPNPDEIDALDDFGAEPEALSAEDSPRELARKMIAAREVRKRQVKKKTDKPIDDGAAVETGEAPALESQPEPAIVPEPLLVSGGLFAAVNVEPAPEAPLEAVQEVTTPLVDTPAPPSPPLELATPTRSEEIVEIPRLEPVDLTATPRDHSDRIVAVDEFRAREAAASKADRGWLRVPERTTGSERSLLDRSERTIAPKASTDKIDFELPPPPVAVDESALQPQTPTMLHNALVLGLGLMVGFGLGHVYATRERSASAPVAAVQPAPSAPEQQTPGTSGRTPAKETEQVVPPPSVPSETAARATPPPAATAPPAKTTPPAAAPAARPTRAAPTSGRLVVTSNPAKAAVTINGKWSGRTPLTVDDLKFGKYVVRIVQPGYEVAREQFTLSATAAARTVDVTLQRAPASNRAPTPEPKVSQTPPATAEKAPATGTGVIVIDSRPQGARAFVDGKDYGVTPLRLTGQPVGQHAVRLELANHLPWTSTTRVVAQETAFVTGSLEPIR